MQEELLQLIQPGESFMKCHQQGMNTLKEL